MPRKAKPRARLKYLSSYRKLKRQVEDLQAHAHNLEWDLEIAQRKLRDANRQIDKEEEKVAYLEKRNRAFDKEEEKVAYLEKRNRAFVETWEQILINARGGDVSREELVEIAAVGAKGWNEQ